MSDLNAARDMVIAAADRTQLFARVYRWQETDRPVVWFVHGLGEHAGRYDHVARAACDAGWRVAAVDHRGHGRSGGRRTDVVRFEEYVNDLQTIARWLRLPLERAVMVGHSAGGLIVARYLQTSRETPAAAILSGPLLGLSIPVSTARWVAGRCLSWLWPTVRFATNVDEGNLTHDAEFLQRRLRDPLILRSITARWFFAMQHARRAAWLEQSAVKTPLLMLLGDADRTVDLAAAERWLSELSFNDKTLRRFPERFHELFNETDWSRTWADALAWARDRIPSSPMNGARCEG